jgi:hypothetical protein
MLFLASTHKKTRKVKRQINTQLIYPKKRFEHMLFLEVITMAFAHKKSTAKCPKSVHILLKMAKSLIIKYNLSIIFLHIWIDHNE